VPNTTDIFLFEGFRLDRQGEGLSRRNENGVFVPVVIGLRALDVLGLLVARAGELVTKEEIMAAVWGRTVVENANLTVQISALRRVIDDGREDSSCIQTVAARGYRFVAPVTRVEQTASLADESDETVAIARPSRPPPAETRGYRRRLAPFTAGAAAVLAIAGIAWWAWPTPHLPAASAPFGASAPLPAPRLSIVVLPFANLSSDPGQQYFADGITEDLTTDLSRLPNMLVIARNTAFTYKNKPEDAKQIGRELGVRYLLEGSVQRSGNEVRVTTQLIDAETGTHLWAERFDRAVGDLFALQSDITSHIAVALNLELVAAEAARPSSNPDSLEYILRARAAWAKPPTRDGYAEVIDLFEHAVAADPASIDAQSWLANAVTGRVLDGFSSAPAVDIERAKALLDPALAAAPGNPFLHYIKGQISRAVAQGPFGLAPEERTARFADAIPEYEIYLTANPNAVGAMPHLAWCKFMTGAADEAMPLLEKAIRLSPRDPYLFLWYARLGTVHFFQGRLDEAILWLDKSRRANPSFPMSHALLSAAYGLKGDQAHAAAELAAFNESAKRRHDNRWSTITAVRRNSDWNTPALHDRFEQYFVAGLRKAGVPED